jgi:hypothetical protein
MNRRRQIPALMTTSVLLLTTACSRAGSGPATGGPNDVDAAEDVEAGQDASTSDNEAPPADDVADTNSTDSAGLEDVDESDAVPELCTKHAGELPIPGQPCDSIGATRCTNDQAYVIEDACSTCYYVRTQCQRPKMVVCEQHPDGSLEWVVHLCTDVVQPAEGCFPAGGNVSCQVQPDGSGSCCPLGVQTGAGGLCNDEDSLAGGLPLTVKKRACLNSEEILQTHTQDLPVYSECAHAFPQCRFKDYTGDGCSTKNPSVLCEVGKDKWGEPECKCFSSTTVPDETGLLICSTTCEQLGKKAGDCAGRSWPPCGDTRDGEP